MDAAGEIAKPPNQPVSAEILQLADIHITTMSESEVYSLAQTLAEMTPENDVLFSEDPALWRAFALLEALQVIPNPRELLAYQKVVLADSNSDKALESLLDIEAVRDTANDIAAVVYDAYMLLLSEDATAAHRADEQLDHYAQADIVRVLNAIRENGTIPASSLTLTARTLSALF